MIFKRFIREKFTRNYQHLYAARSQNICYNRRQLDVSQTHSRLVSSSSSPHHKEKYLFSVHACLCAYARTKLYMACIFSFALNSRAQVLFSFMVIYRFIRVLNLLNIFFLCFGRCRRRAVHLLLPPPPPPSWCALQNVK